MCFDGICAAVESFEKLPGGWFMVVMDHIDDTFEELDDSPKQATFAAEVWEKVVSLHFH